MREKVLGVAFVCALVVGACVDGTTPDCSDAAAQCGPNLDGAILEGGPSEGGADAAVEAAAEAAADAAADAPADASTADARDAKVD